MGFMSGKKNKEIAKVVLLPLEKIVSNPNQPRKHFDQEAIQELCRSIVSNGLLQPVTVRQLEDSTYELVAGERRAMAYRCLGREHIPAIVEEFSDAQSAVMALVENLQRKDLNYFEESAGIARLMVELNITQSQLSQRLGKAQSTVANKLRLQKIPVKIQNMILEGGLSERHARAMLKISDPELLEQAVKQISEQNLTVEQTERYIEQLLENKSKSLHTRIFVVKDMRMFLNTVNKAVDMMRASGIPVDLDKRDEDNHVEVILKIPKDAVYRTSSGVNTATETASAGM